MNYKHCKVCKTCPAPVLATLMLSSLTSHQFSLLQFTFPAVCFLLGAGWFRNTRALRKNDVHLQSYTRIYIYIVLWRGRGSPFLTSLHNALELSPRPLRNSFFCLDNPLPILQPHPPPRSFNALFLSFLVCLRQPPSQSLPFFISSLAPSHSYHQAPALHIRPFPPVPSIFLCFSQNGHTLVKQNQIKYRKEIESHLLNNCSKTNGMYIFLKKTYLCILF